MISAELKRRAADLLFDWKLDERLVFGQTGLDDALVSYLRTLNRNNVFLPAQIQEFQDYARWETWAVCCSETDETQDLPQSAVTASARVSALKRSIVSFRARVEIKGRSGKVFEYEFNWKQRVSQ